MDLHDQLKQLFPDHIPEKEGTSTRKEPPRYGLQQQPIYCKYEKCRGKPVTLVEGYTGAEADFKALTRHLKTQLGVGGSYKNDVIILQGNYRDKIMNFLKLQGFVVKRVGG